MKLIAPNGKPSNLNAEQYKLVRTPAFKKWFGDWENINYELIKQKKVSIVIDSFNINKADNSDTLEPFVVYHASDNEFDVFDLNKADYREKGWFGTGFYFGENENEVKRYGKIVKPYFLKLVNPYYFFGHQKEFADNFDLDYWGDYDVYSRTIREKLIDMGYDGVIASSTYGREFVCFYPNQIKLADGSNTTFDDNNDDIRYEKGGLLVNFNYSIGGL